MLAVVPGRVRRAWALVVLAASIFLALPSLLDVYEHGRASSVPADVSSGAATAALLAALGAAVVWGLASLGAKRSQAALSRLRPAAAGVLIAASVVGVGVAVASGDRISRTLDEQYTSFVRLGIEPQGSGVASAEHDASRLRSRHALRLLAHRLGRLP